MHIEPVFSPITLTKLRNILLNANCFEKKYLKNCDFDMKKVKKTTSKCKESDILKNHGCRMSILPLQVENLLEMEIIKY